LYVVYTTTGDPRAAPLASDAPISSTSVVGRGPTPLSLPLRTATSTHGRDGSRQRLHSRAVCVISSMLGTATTTSGDAARDAARAASAIAKPRTVLPEPPGITTVARRPPCSK
jgi:hypothetical protein